MPELDPANILERLVAVPQRIAQIVDGWGDEKLHSSVEDSWSAAEILAHLRASDDILAYRAYAILASDNPRLHPYDERRWAEVARYVSLDFSLSLTLYALRRAELANMLSTLSAEQWQRSGVHDVRGVITLYEVLSDLLEHEEEHCAQLEALIQ